MDNTLFEITSNQTTRLCHAENFGCLMELLKLLHQVRRTKFEAPELDEGRWLTYFRDKEHGLRVLSLRPATALMKPLSAEKFEQKLRLFHENTGDTRHVVLDYDSDHFTFSEWKNGEQSNLSGSLDGVIKAYGVALRKKSATQFYLNQEAFEIGMAAVCIMTGNAPVSVSQQHITDFILAQQTADLWPWFVSVEEMVGNPQRLQEVERLLADMDTAQGGNDEQLFDALTEVFGANPALAQTPWQEM